MWEKFVENIKQFILNKNKGYEMFITCVKIGNGQDKVNINSDVNQVITQEWTFGQDSRE